MSDIRRTVPGYTAPETKSQKKRRKKKKIKIENSVENTTCDTAKDDATNQTSADGTLGETNSFEQASAQDSKCGLKVNEENPEPKDSSDVLFINQSFTQRIGDKSHSSVNHEASEQVDVQMPPLKEANDDANYSASIKSANQLASVNQDSLPLASQSKAKDTVPDSWEQDVATDKSDEGGSAGYIPTVSRSNEKTTSQTPELPTPMENQSDLQSGSNKEVEMDNNANDENESKEPSSTVDGFSDAKEQQQSEVESKRTGPIQGQKPDGRFYDSKNRFHPNNGRGSNFPDQQQNVSKSQPRGNYSNYSGNNRNHDNYRGHSQQQYGNRNASYPINDGNRGNFHGRGRGGGGHVQGGWEPQYVQQQTQPDPRYAGGSQNTYHGNGAYYYQDRGSGYQNNDYRSSAGRRDIQHYADDWRADDVELSKEIVRVVRHGKYKEIKMDKEGYVCVNDILRNKKFQHICGNVTFEDVKFVVENNDKKRFELKEINSKWFIKATQGHTVQVECLELKPLKNSDDYPNVFHGTYFEAWDVIKSEGLNRMKRNHIHFAIGLPDERQVISGMRSSSQVVIELDLKKAMKAGLKFFVSSNNVVLCEGDEKGRIHPKFFSRVTSRRPFQLLRFDVPPDYDGKRPSSPEKPESKKRNIPGMTEKVEKITKPKQTDKRSDNNPNLATQNQPPAAKGNRGTKKKDNPPPKPTEPKFEMPSAISEKQEVSPKEPEFEMPTSISTDDKVSGRAKNHSPAVTSHDDQKGKKKNKKKQKKR